MAQKLKRILALIAVIAIFLLVIATFIVALLDFPNKMVVFTGMIAGIIFLPIFAWLLLWMIGILSKKKNIASFRSEEMEKTMAQAEEIKYVLSQSEKENLAAEDTSDTTTNQ